MKSLFLEDEYSAVQEAANLEFMEATIVFGTQKGVSILTTQVPTVD